MTYTLEQMNLDAVRDPKAFVEESEHHYHTQVEQTASLLVQRMKQRPIVLLNGPSSSGKTTTARLFGEALATHGVHAEIISMDDYYRTRSDYAVPTDEEGQADFESPACMDLPLLRTHLLQLAAGQEIAVPRFDFEKQRRGEETECLSLDADEIAVIEGIHALSDVITGELGEKASGVYLSLGSSVALPEGELVEPETLRFMRRAVRDRNFRGSSVEMSLRQWRSVRRGERLYIAPYRHNASLEIDSYLPYETGILMHKLEQALTQSGQALEEAGLSQLRALIGRFETVDYTAYMPENSVLHEFIG